jgi:hypothetical protein
VGVVFASAWLIDEEGNSLGQSKTLRQLGLPETDHAIFTFAELVKAILAHGNFLVTPSAMVRASIQEKLGQWGVDASLGAAADLDAWLQIAHGHEVGLLAKPLMRYRYSRGQHSYQYNRLRTDPAEYLRVMDRWMADDAVKGHLSAADGERRAELERRDRIECAARALLLDRVALARRLLADATEIRARQHARGSLKHSLLAQITTVGCWPVASHFCKPIVARSLARKRAW